MPEKQNRKLAAILFADIAGYTALMQKDEQSASVLLRRFQKNIEELIPKNNGQIINFYGDGALCIFNNPLEAVRCAMELQNIFSENPIVPVRLGLHSGTVVFENGKIYGDSVNLASRIESMGIPGAILFSKKIRDEIKNQPDIKITSLGSFAFKNVEEEMEVFVLANEGFIIPDKKELKGKFKNTEKEPVPNSLREKSIAILAFENRSGDPEQEYFSDGISEEIIYALSKLEKLKVAGRTSSFSFKGKKLDLIEVGNKLNVKNLLEGSVRKMGNRVRVTAQLVSVESGFQIWTERFDRELEDIFAIQDDIAQNIVEKLELTLLKDQEKKPLVEKPTQNIDAYQWYLRGRYYLDQRAHVDLAISCFQKALDLDPNYALAHTGMGYAYFYQVVIANFPPKTFLRAKASAQRAKELDPTIAEPYLIEGVANFYYHWDDQKALEQYEKALSLNPNSHDIYRVKAYYHSMTGDLGTAEQLARKAAELDPLNLNSQLSLAEILYRAHHFSNAVKVLEKLIVDFSENKVAYILLGNCYYRLGKKEMAEKYFKLITATAQENSFYLTSRLLFYIETGRPEEAKKLIVDIEKNISERWDSPACIALLYFGLGEEKKASEYLQKALEERDPILKIAIVEPSWDKYRQNPIVQKVFKKMSII